MSKKIIVTKKDNFIISCLVDSKSKLLDISLDSNRFENILDNIYAGKVVNVLPNINASFVEFKIGQKGFLPLLLKSNEKVMVQVVKDSIKGKEPMLSTEPVIKGKYAILITKHNGIHFSYKIKNSKKKDELKKLYDELDINDCGFIVRTKAAYVDNEIILNEIKRLNEMFMQVLKDFETVNPYSCIYKSPPSHIDYLIDSRENEITSIDTNYEDIYLEIKDYLEKFQPKEKKILHFYNPVNNPPFSVVYSIKKNLHDAFSRKVYLEHGGYLIIDYTEAMTVIDVNSGSDVSDDDSEEGFLKINLEAAKEAARHIRLRNLSGIILIDFINLSKKESKEIMLEYLKKCLDDDPLGPNVVDMTKLGIVEITRKRAKKPLHEVVPEKFFD